MTQYIKCLHGDFAVVLNILAVDSLDRPPGRRGSSSPPLHRPYLSFAARHCRRSTLATGAPVPAAAAPLATATVAPLLPPAGDDVEMASILSASPPPQPTLPPPPLLQPPLSMWTDRQLQQQPAVAVASGDHRWRWRRRNSDRRRCRDPRG